MNKPSNSPIALEQLYQRQMRIRFVTPLEETENSDAVGIVSLFGQTQSAMQAQAARSVEEVHDAWEQESISQSEDET